MYLGALGFLPVGEDRPDIEMGEERRSVTSYSVQLEDWLQGYQCITGLLETDLSQFSPIHILRNIGS